MLDLKSESLQPTHGRVGELNGWSSLAFSSAFFLSLSSGVFEGFSCTAIIKLFLSAASQSDRIDFYP